MNDADDKNQAMCKFPLSKSATGNSYSNHSLFPDDPKLMAEAPVALQIVGPKWGDEQLLKDVETIDLALKN